MIELLNGLHSRDTSIRNLRLSHQFNEVLIDQDSVPLELRIAANLRQLGKGEIGNDSYIVFNGIQPPVRLSYFQAQELSGACAAMEWYRLHPQAVRNQSPQPVANNSLRDVGHERLFWSNQSPADNTASILARTMLVGTEGNTLLIQVTYGEPIYPILPYIPAYFAHVCVITTESDQDSQVTDHTETHIFLRGSKKTMERPFWATMIVQKANNKETTMILDSAGKILEVLTEE